jgi:hypothetical protein
VPRPPASQTKAIIQKFAIVIHEHGLPVCTATKHSKSCGKQGIWLGCRRTGKVKRIKDYHGNVVFVDDAYAMCMHLRA